MLQKKLKDRGHHNQARFQPVMVHSSAVLTKSATSCAATCACINLLTEKLGIPDLARIVCSYVPKRSDRDIILAHIRSTGDLTMFNSRYDDSICTLPVIEIVKPITYSCNTINVNIMCTRKDNIILVHIRYSPKAMCTYSYRQRMSFDMTGSYDPTIISKFVKSANTRHLEHIELNALVYIKINKYIESILDSRDYRHASDKSEDTGTLRTPKSEDRH